jgi:predicted transcriptional regulator
VTEADGWKNQSKRAEPSKTITARLPVTLVDRVDAIAVAHDTTRTAIVEHQLELFVNEQARVAVEKAPPAPAELFD